MRTVQFVLGRRVVRLGTPLVAVAALLAACETTAPEEPVVPKVYPRRETPAVRYDPVPGLTPRQRVGRAIELLGQGDPARARPEVEAFLVSQPTNELGKSLLAQIDRDPRDLLGAQSFPYELKAGETLSSVAERFLGDRFMFWALARYNGIDVPSKAEVGQTVMIPGVPRTPTAPRRRLTDAALIDSRLAVPKPVTPRSTPTTPSVKPAPQTPSAPPAATRDPARARQLRGSALEYLSRGVVDRAVSLLEQALRLDPGNTLIIRDLERARRLLKAR
jgi:hypothetical protein